MTILFQNRIILLGSHYITGALFVYPFSYFIFDIIAEVYGYKWARKILLSSILCFIIFAVLIKLVTLSPMLMTTSGDSFSNFNIAMSSILKVGLIDGYAILIGQLVNIFAITKLKILTSGKFFPLRSAFSTIIGDTVTCLLAILGVFIQHASLLLMLNIILNELIVMFIFAIVLALPGSIIIYLIRKSENTDLISSRSEIKYNPFMK